MHVSRLGKHGNHEFDLSPKEIQRKFCTCNLALSICQAEDNCTPKMTVFKNKICGYHTPKLSMACVSVLIWLQAIHSQFGQRVKIYWKLGGNKKHYKWERWIRIDCKWSNLSLQ